MFQSQSQKRALKRRENAVNKAIRNLGGETAKAHFYSKYLY